MEEDEQDNGTGSPGMRGEGLPCEGQRRHKLLELYKMNKSRKPTLIIFIWRVIHHLLSKSFTNKCLSAAFKNEH
jgi:hypothetical protein